MTKLVVLFAAAPAAHWAPRFVAGGVDAVVGTSPTVTADGVVEGLPAQQHGVAYLVNARVAGVMAGSGRSDLFSLPQGALQDGSPVKLDYLVQVV